MSTIDRYKLFDLSSKVAVVTGGAGIIGQQMCRGLAEFGANVAVIDINEERALQLADEVSRTHGTRCTGLACDVSDPQAVRDTINTVLATYGGIHILVNNAATKTDELTDFFTEFEDYSLSTWRKVMAVNLDGMFLVAQAVGKQMIEQGGGSIIQTASIYGALGPDNRIYDGSRYLSVGINSPGVYSASKAGVIGLTRYLATRWAKHGIRVNTLIPGGVESGQNQAFIDKYSQRIPLGRMANVDELVGAVIYLASDAASYVTGHSLFVDGGLHAW